MTEQGFNWRRFEHIIAARCKKAIQAAMSQFPEESYYAAAFHEFYAEEWQLITLPTLALNTEEELAPNEDLRWSSADWYWTDLPLRNTVVDQLISSLNNEANRSDADHWQTVYDAMMQSIVRIAKKLTVDLKQHKCATKDFGFFVFADEHPDGMQILRQCMTKAQFKRRFAHLQAILDEEARCASLSPGQQNRIYREDLYKHQYKIVSMGKAAISLLLDCLKDPEQGWIAADLLGRVSISMDKTAIPLLLDCLKDPEQGWRAADLLGQVGIRQDRIIKALRQQTTAPGRERFHETAALVLLGDVDFVVKLAESADSREAAIRGIKRSYSTTADECRSPFLLDYKPIEQLLKKKSCQRFVRKAFSPGGVYEIALPHRDIGVENLDAAISGTKSKHRMIREHAVGCLGNRKLGKSAGERAMPAIVTLFNDRCFNVRRLAMLSLSRWKKDAKPYLPDLKKMCRDSDPNVREWARYCLREM